MASPNRSKIPCRRPIPFGGRAHNCPPAFELNLDCICRSSPVLPALLCPWRRMGRVWVYCIPYRDGPFGMAFCPLISREHKTPLSADNMEMMSRRSSSILRYIFKFKLTSRVGTMGSHRDSLVAAMVILLVLDIAAIASRLYVRTRLIKHSFGRDDGLLCLTMVCATFFPHYKSEAQARPGG